jgi:sigma-B regulation protein RsbU (phosphoserine phosphatase)
MLDSVVLDDSSMILQPGDVLVLHTDGVTEARQGNRFLGDDGLDEWLLDGPVQSARELADRIVADAVAFQNGDPRDDIALLVIRVPEDRLR